MKGFLVFLAVFSLILLVTLGYPTLPPGRLIYDMIGGSSIDYPILGISVMTLVPAVNNGLVYGVAAWLIYHVSSSQSNQKKHREQIKEDQRLILTLDQQKPMSVPIKSVEGIGSTFAEKLEALDITTTGSLLEAGKTSQKRDTLAKKSGISRRLLLEWVNLADLIRIKGVSEEFSELLEESGVNTVPELARRKQENLYHKLREVNDEKKLVGRLPSASTVGEWIEQAKKLPRIVEY